LPAKQRRNNSTRDRSTPIGGYCALLGANVSNEGVISADSARWRSPRQRNDARRGRDGLLNVAVDQGAVNALVQNGGLIQADGDRYC